MIVYLLTLHLSVLDSLKLSVGRAVRVWCGPRCMDSNRAFTLRGIRKLNTMKTYSCLLLMRFQSASLLAFLATGLLFSAVTPAIAGPGVDYWRRQSVQTPSAKPAAVSPADPVTSKACISCKIVDVKRVVPSANGRFQQTVVEKKVICTIAEGAVASSCCAPTDERAAAKTDTHGA